MAASAPFVRIIVAALVAVLAFSAPALAGPWLLFDVGTGRVLSKNDEFKRWYPASLSKLMTVYVTFKALGDGEIELDSPVYVSKNSASEPPAKIGYKPGSVLTFDNALKILLTKSANDMATAIAESVAGSEQAFVKRMNEEAQNLGMFGSHFDNPHGLFSPGQYTTARDLAVLVRALRTGFPQYAGYFRIEAIDAGGHIIPNYNLLIGRFAGADGMKTGFICESGFNEIGTATRDGRTLAAVVLGTNSQVERAARAAELLAKGFAMSPVGAPTLASLEPPPGLDLTAATDLRSTVCSKQAQSERWDERDANGKLVLPTNYMHHMDRPPHAVKVGLGGANGPASPAPHYADVPIPTPRPDYPPASETTVGDGG